ncbi:MAG: phospholipid/cholesterol/gamma-HCH transport system substrate-binding protein [Streptomyces sp.]|nr:phospholipid/cholesterol/gamma-HCH transport system substrate-binding protein [Streptomyces sp.]
MISRTVKLQLAAFAAVTALGVSYVGAEYAGLGERIMDRGYTVHVDFADSGGVFSGAEVTYRGVPVGRVGGLRLSGADGVAVDLRITGGSRIPADTLAVVANRSAVGEQYVDLQPRTATGPYLHDGSSIARRDTRTPLPTTELILSLDRLVNSVGKKDLKVTVDELGSAFAGTGPDLTRLVDSGNSLVDAAERNLPQTIGLIESSRTVLKTQADKGSAIRSFSHDLADLSATLKDRDADIRHLMDNGVSASHELDALLKDNSSALPVLLGNLISGGQVVVARLPGLEQALVTFPAVVAGSFTVLPGDNTAHFGLVVNADDPPPCRQGYGSTQRRDPADTADRPANTQARCTAPRGSKTSVRGAQNAPKGSVSIGSTGGQQAVFGKDSWQWLLVGPMV